MLGGINHLGHPLEKCSFLLYVGRSKIPKQGTKWGKSAEQHNWAKPDTPQLITSIITNLDKPHEDEECCTVDMDIIVINKELKGVAKSESSSSHCNRGHRAEWEGGKGKVGLPLIKIGIQIQLQFYPKFLWRCYGHSDRTKLLIRTGFQSQVKFWVTLTWKQLR